MNSNNQFEKPQTVNRRTFLQTGAAAAAALISTPMINFAQSKKIRIGVIGCGSVSNAYLPHLSKCPYAELVSACDIIVERAERQAKWFNIPHVYPNIDAMLTGAPFDLLVNLTDMQAHEHLNRKALEAGKHVWSEKPMANSYAAGVELLKLARRKNLRLWGAPAMVESPAFAIMAKILAEGKLGDLAAVHAFYGHTGPWWSSFFYEKGGGSMPDLMVYNLTTVTGLVGPAKAVTAMTSIVTPTREIDGKGRIKVEAEDNAMVLLDHGKGIISHVQSGFNYFNPHGHEGKEESRYTIQFFGTKGFMGLLGYDWEPLAVEIATEDAPKIERISLGQHNFVWQMGASLACESLATGRELLITPEHALHVLEIIQAARESQAKGRRIALRSTFKYPIVA
ncbi:MAG: Gfo/Idh/MocA family oxidoreductase [candidate division KSB1 bacterium]|nr:Gfo/Idh/MocA family oxidoreductase [candidate division KSB1 bacterium]